MPKVSIIIPVYNVGSYIERCIHSVMQQTFSDIECILVDDCGTDNSMTIVEKLINQYNGPITFKILRHEHNRGLSAARNTGSSVATSEYIYFLDSDDALTPNCIQTLIQKTYEYPDVEIIIGNTKSIPYNSFFDITHLDIQGLLEDHEKINYYFFKYGEELPVTAWNKLVKTSFLKKNNIVFLEGVIHEDELWSFHSYKKAKKIYIVREATYIHYYTTNSIMSNLDMTVSAISIMRMLTDICHHFDNPCHILQLYKYIYIFIQKYKYAYKSTKCFKLIVSFTLTLIFNRKYKIALKFLRYTLLFKNHHGERPKYFVYYIESNWKNATTIAAKRITN